MVSMYRQLPETIMNDQPQGFGKAFSHTGFRKKLRALHLFVWVRCHA